MTASRKILNPGNLAIETCVYTLDATAFKAIKSALKTSGRLTPGGYWTRQINDAAARGRKNGGCPVVTTAGFGASEFEQLCAACGVTVER